MAKQKVEWMVREPPLPICGVLAGGSAALVLADRLARDDAQSDVFVGGGAIVAVGEDVNLPWADGATWLGRDGSLLCPPRLRPDMNPTVVATAIRNAAGTNGLAVMTENETVLLRRVPSETDRSELVQLVRESAQR